MKQGLLGDVGYISTHMYSGAMGWGGRVMTVDGYTTEPAAVPIFIHAAKERSEIGDC